MKNEESVCSCSYCGAKTIKHWHRLSKGLAESLIEFKKAVITLNRNKIHIKDELSLSKSAYNNFQKMRYHGLVAKYVNPETKRNEQGYWLLTRRGNLWLKGEIKIPIRVQTFRNQISDRDISEIVSIYDVLLDSSVPYWDSKQDMTYEFPNVFDFNDVEYDMKGQMIIRL